MIITIIINIIHIIIILALSLSLLLFFGGGVGWGAVYNGGLYIQVLKIGDELKCNW